MDLRRIYWASNLTRTESDRATRLDGRTESPSVEEASAALRLRGLRMEGSEEVCGRL